MYTLFILILLHSQPVAKVTVETPSLQMCETMRAGYTQSTESAAGLKAVVGECNKKADT